MPVPQFALRFRINGSTCVASCLCVCSAGFVRSGSNDRFVAGRQRRGKRLGGQVRACGGPGAPDGQTPHAENPASLLSVARLHRVFRGRRMIRGTFGAKIRDLPHDAMFMEVGPIAR